MGRLKPVIGPALARRPSTYTVGPPERRRPYRFGDRPVGYPSMRFVKAGPQLLEVRSF